MTSQNSTCDVSFGPQGVSVRFDLDEAIGLEHLKGLMVRHGWDAGTRAAVEIMLDGAFRKIHKALQDGLHQAVIDGAMTFEKRDAR